MNSNLAENLNDVVIEIPVYVVEDNKPEENYVLAENAEEREFYADNRVVAMYKRFFGNDYKSFM